MNEQPQKLYIKLPHADHPVTFVLVGDHYEFENGRYQYYLNKTIQKPVHDQAVDMMVKSECNGVLVKHIENEFKEIATNHPASAAKPFLPKALAEKYKARKERIRDQLPMKSAHWIERIFAFLLALVVGVITQPFIYMAHFATRSDVNTRLFWFRVRKIFTKNYRFDRQSIHEHEVEVQVLRKKTDLDYEKLYPNGYKLEHSIALTFTFIFNLALVWLQFLAAVLVMPFVFLDGLFRGTFFLIKHHVFGWGTAVLNEESDKREEMDTGIAAVLMAPLARINKFLEREHTKYTYREVDRDGKFEGYLTTRILDQKCPVERRGTQPYSQIYADVSYLSFYDLVILAFMLGKFSAILTLIFPKWTFLHWPTHIILKLLGYHLPTIKTVSPLIAKLLIFTVTKFSVIGAILALAGAMYFLTHLLSEIGGAIKWLTAVYNDNKSWSELGKHFGMRVLDFIENGLGLLIVAPLYVLFNPLCYAADVVHKIRTSTIKLWENHKWYSAPILCFFNVVFRVITVPLYSIVGIFYAPYEARVNIQKYGFLYALRFPATRINDEGFAGSNYSKFNEQKADHQATIYTKHALVFNASSLVSLPIIIASLVGLTFGVGIAMHVFFPFPWMAGLIAEISLPVVSLCMGVAAGAGVAILTGIVYGLVSVIDWVGYGLQVAFWSKGSDAAAEPKVGAGTESVESPQTGLLGANEVKLDEHESDLVLSKGDQSSSSHDIPYPRFPAACANAAST